MTNIETTIDNKKITKDESCNCRKRQTCPLEGGECRAENLIYQATIKTDNSSKIYIGLSANQLKKPMSTYNKTTKLPPV